jgi:multiple antibiotic resistance protein
VSRAHLVELFQFSLLSLSAIFFVVDPLAVVPIFLGMTRQDSEEKRRAMALRASITACCVLVVFALAGTLVFRLFGFTLGAFKVAGGILLMLTSIEMLAARPPRTRVTEEEAREGEGREDIAIFPLAIPLLAGPGAIATVMTLMARAGRMVYAVPVILSIIVTCAASYFILRAAGRVARLLGVTGLTVLNRIIGLFIAALAVQFIFDGVASAFPKLAG